jgi:uncharacterized protein YukE
MYWHHPTINSATDQLTQANKQMNAQIDALDQELLPLSNSFKGKAAGQWSSIYAQKQQMHDNLNADLGKGAVLLSNMHETIVRADNQSAANMG